MARPLSAGCRSGVAGFLYRMEGGRIAGVAGWPYAKSETCHVPAERHSPVWIDVPIRNPADDRLQFLLARYAGSVSDISAKRSWLLSCADRQHRHRLQH